MPIGQLYKKDESYAFVESYLKLLDYDFNDDSLDPESYVSHPVSHHENS